MSQIIKLTEAFSLGHFGPWAAVDWRSNNGRKEREGRKMLKLVFVCARPLNILLNFQPTFSEVVLSLVYTWKNWGSELSARIKNETQLCSVPEPFPTTPCSGLEVWEWRWGARQATERRCAGSGARANGAVGRACHTSQGLTATGPCQLPSSNLDPRFLCCSLTQGHFRPDILA